MSSADTASAHGRSERTVSPSTPTPSDEKLGVSSLGSAAAHPAQDATPAASVDEKLALPTPSSESVAPYRIRTTDFGFLPIRKSLRHDPDLPYVFTIWTIVFFGFCSTFTVAMLYWAQPLLVDMAATFDVSYQQVSLIPTMSQAGYATGMLLLSPLGDLIRRRPFLLIIEGCATLLSIGLATTNNVHAFMALSFLVAVCTITPQILLTYAADLAPPHRRAEAIATVLSGLMFGVACARVLAGVIAYYAHWQIVYQMSVGLQAAIWVLLWAIAPDTPAKQTGLNYFGILASMVKFAFTEPILIFAALMAMSTSVLFSDLWVTLTFLLTAEPYRYSTLEIGLFGLIGIVGICAAPFTGRLVDRLVPNVGVCIALCILLVAQTIEISAGGVHVAAPIFCIILTDLGNQLSQVSNSSKVYSIEPQARARMNAVFILFVFIGQVIGSSAGSRVFLSAGWRANSAFCFGFVCFALFLLTLRGPHEDRYTWFGWKRGHDFIKRDRGKPPVPPQTGPAGAGKSV